MGVINLSRDQQDAIKAIDARGLEKLVQQAIRDEHLGDLNLLPLAGCGPYVSTMLDRFSAAIAKYRKAQASKKLAETLGDARRAGSDLCLAFSRMQQRMETEEKERQFFQIDDDIRWPHRFAARLSVTVAYRWRRAVDDTWTSGSITFVHDVDPSPNPALPASKRAPGPTKRDQEWQSELRQKWEDLAKGALCSVRDYFRNGHDPSNIPESFQAGCDPYTRAMTNSSTQFWREKPSPSS